MKLIQSQDDVTFGGLTVAQVKHIMREADETFDPMTFDTPGDFVPLMLFVMEHRQKMLVDAQPRGDDDATA